MSPRERKTREQRAAETQAILDEVDASRAADANAGEDPGFARQVGRDFAEETGWLLIQAALFVVPCVIGLLVGGGLGLVVGFGVGILLLGAFWVVVTVTGLKGLRQTRREARQQGRQLRG